MQWKMRHKFFCWNVPYIYNLINDAILALFENILLGSLKYLFQLEQQVNISLYLMDATAPPL